MLSNQEKDGNGLMRYVDTHIHGAFGDDTSDGNVDGIIRMARNLTKLNITAFCPTTMTISTDDIYRSFDAVAKARDILKQEGGEYARILGIHLEGPFLNPSKAGVQASECCLKPSEGFNLIDKLDSEYPGLLSIIDIAPELDGGMEFISEFSKTHVISLAHTDADYDTAFEAFDRGATSVTHTLNAMNSCTKRSPGVLGAAFDKGDIFCEVICDGIHIQPPVLRMLFKLIAEDRLIVVSDSMRGSGMPDGCYKLGSIDVLCKDGRTYYGESGGLAGSVTNMMEEAEILERIGISQKSIQLATYDNPLRRLGL